jgi:hypothetical protein
MILCNFFLPPPLPQSLLAHAAADFVKYASYCLMFFFYFFNIKAGWIFIALDFVKYVSYCLILFLQIYFFFFLFF